MTSPDLSNQRIADLEAELAQIKEQAHQTELRLQESQRMLQLVLDTIPIRVFWKDKDLTYLGCNSLFARDAGLSTPAAIIGKSDFELGWAEQAELYRADDFAVINSGQAKIGYEEPQTTPDGSKIWLRTNKIPLYNNGGNIFGVLGTYDDVTDRRQAEEEREQLQQEIIEAQRRAIQELSTPVIPVMDRIIIMPLIGSIDSLRAREITRTLLAGIREQRAKVVILDITGVPIVDSGVANHLNKTIQAARLKGAQTIVTGISDAVAETIVDLGIDWNGIETLANLQTGLVVALARLGLKLSPI